MSRMVLPPKRCFSFHLSLLSGVSPARPFEFLKWRVVIFFVFIAYEEVFAILLRHLEVEVLENLQEGEKSSGT